MSSATTKMFYSQHNPASPKATNKSLKRFCACGTGQSGSKVKNLPCSPNTRCPCKNNSLPCDNDRGCKCCQCNNPHGPRQQTKSQAKRQHCGKIPRVSGAESVLSQGINVRQGRWNLSETLLIHQVLFRKKTIKEVTEFYNKCARKCVDCSEKTQGAIVGKKKTLTQHSKIKKTQSPKTTE